MCLLLIVFTLFTSITKIQTITFYKLCENDAGNKNYFSLWTLCTVLKDFKIYIKKKKTSIKGKNNLTLINAVAS